MSVHIDHKRSQVQAGRSRDSPAARHRRARGQHHHRGPQLPDRHRPRKGRGDRRGKPTGRRFAPRRGPRRPRHVHRVQAQDRHHRRLRPRPQERPATRRLPGAVAKAGPRAHGHPDRRQVLAVALAQCRTGQDGPALRLYAGGPGPLDRPTSGCATTPSLWKRTSNRPDPRSPSSFGPNSPTYQRDIATLKALYGEYAGYNTIKVKRQLWQNLLTAALGEIAGDPAQMDDLFVRHTYLTAVIGMVVQASFGSDIYATWPRPTPPTSSTAATSETRRACRASWSPTSSLGQRRSAASPCSRPSPAV